MLNQDLTLELKETSLASRAYHLIGTAPRWRSSNSLAVRVGSDERVYVSLGISGNYSDEYLGADYPTKHGGEMHKI